MPWGTWGTQTPNIWLGLMVGFGIVIVAMLVGFYMLLKSLEEIKMSINKNEGRLEKIEKNVDKVVKQLEEI